MKSTIFFLSLLLIGASVLPTRAFALYSSDPAIFITSVNSNSVELLQYSLDINTELFIETEVPKKVSYKLGVVKHEGKRQSFKLPPKSLRFGSLYVIVARDTSGRTLAQSQKVQVGGFAKDAPVCNAKSNRDVVSPEETFTLSWNSPRAKSVYKSVGFSDEPQKSLKKKGEMKLSSSIVGIRQYTLIFGAASGNQSACTAFVVVADVEPGWDYSTEDTIVIDALPLETRSLRPTLTGTAEGAKSVRITVSELNEKAGFVWVSKPITVKDGEWSVRVGKLPKRNADYGVEVHIYDNGQYGASERATLSVQ